MAEKIPARAEIPDDKKWSIEDLYASDDAWERDFVKTADFGEKISSFKGKISQSADALYECLRLFDEISVLFDGLANYAQRRSDEDTRVSKYQDMTSRLMAAYVRFADAASFSTPEIISISDEKLGEFYKNKPELELYRRLIDKMRSRREHILSENEERILALTGEMCEAPDTIFSMLNDADMKFPDAEDKDGTPHALTHESYIAYMRGSDRTLRKNAFKSLYGVYKGHENTLAATLSAQMKTLAFGARARKYSSALEASLMPNEVDTAVYHSLIEAVRENLPLLHRYIKINKKALGYEDFHAYDLSAPTVPNSDEKIPFDRAVEEVYESIAPLGEEYRAIFKKGIEQRWIDVYENEGKRSGAYSAGARVHPFVMLNHKDNLNSEFTLAHEMGHAIHSYLSNKNQPVCYSDYVIFVAEVASTCNESLLMQYLLKNTPKTDKKRRAILVNYFLEQFRTTLFRQTMFAEFELWLSQTIENGGSLTPETLCEKYHELNVEYYGDGFVCDEELDMEWARIPHFYYDFYVYQYATGFSAAIALSKRILEQGETAVADYIGFLSSGSAKDPISLLKGAGVDMTSKKVVSDALKLFKELLDETEALLDA